MGKYELTPADIQAGVNRILAEAYSSAVVSENPTMVYVTAGPGAGKTSIEMHLKKEFRDKGEKAFIINSDKIATFHPNYDEIRAEELPAECYRLTRQFVRPATPQIFDELIKNKINMINENTLDKGDSDIEMAKKLKDNKYRICVDIMATDLFESRLSCYEREAAMLLAGINPRGCSKKLQEKMYNSFVKEVQQLDNLGLCDEINVYTRGENINKPPVLQYSKGDKSYSNFDEALKTLRARQRNELFKDPTNYLLRIKNASEIISQYGINPVLTQDALNGLQELEQDFLAELGKEKMI